ncbi:quinon protein alcohol dehydrogenase-like superfamily [Dipodascopsis tothii]|uniref:quinon protein alcohol dehydrogenase-like superfamily n=1 Tax=Dipodascopsis tothii TaxID=44089 RepID=UPI0034CF5E9A
MAGPDTRSVANGNRGLSADTTTTSGGTVPDTSPRPTGAVDDSPAPTPSADPAPGGPSDDRDSARARARDRRPDETTAAAVLPAFLSKHIPQRIYPESYKESRTFCYRHHPDFKCKRQADETTMDVLQRSLENLPQQDQQAITHVWSLFSAAPAGQRNLILHGLLSQCCFPQLSYVSSMLRDLIRIDFVSALPAEVAFKILCYLDAASLCKAAQVSRRWKELADDDIVWHRMCEQHIDRKCTKCGWGLPLMERERLKESRDDMRARAAGLRQQSRADRAAGALPAPAPPPPAEDVADADAANADRALGTKRPADGETAPAKRIKCDPARTTRPWKDVYSERLKVEQNWRRGRYKLRVFKGHTDGIMCLQFDHDILITGSYDTTVKVWCIETGKLLRTLTGHVRGVRALQFDENKLITGSMDRTLKIWNYRTGECLSTLRGHTDGVSSLNFDETLLASGSADSTIRIWNFKEKSFFTLRGHRDWVNAVRIHSPSRKLFSASDDTTVRMWDLDTRECVRIFGGTHSVMRTGGLFPREDRDADAEGAPDAVPDTPQLPLPAPGARDDQSHFGQVQCVLPIVLDDDEDDDEPKIEAVPDTATCSPPAAPTEFAPAVDAPVPDVPVDAPAVREEKAHRLPHILTCSLDNTIKLWNTKTGDCERTLFGHVEGVWGMAADTFRIVTGAHDRLVKVWDLQTGRCLHTLSGHTGPVTCVGLSDSRLASASDDGQVRLYSFGVE